MAGVNDAGDGGFPVDHSCPKRYSYEDDYMNKETSDVTLFLSTPGPECSSATYATAAGLEQEDSLEKETKPQSKTPPRTDHRTLTPKGKSPLTPITGHSGQKRMREAKEDVNGGVRRGQDCEAGRTGFSLPAHNVAAFGNLFKSWYTDVLPTAAASDFVTSLDVLKMAAKYKSLSSLRDCGNVLKNYISSLATNREHAVATLKLHPDILCHEVIKELRQVAKQYVLNTYGEKLGAKLDGDFLSLPEDGLLTLLEAVELPETSDDDVARAAIAWINFNYKNSKDKLEKMCSTVLSRLKLRNMSILALEEVFAFSGFTDAGKTPDLLKIPKAQATALKVLAEQIVMVASETKALWSALLKE